MLSLEHKNHIFTFKDFKYDSFGYTRYPNMVRIKIGDNTYQFLF